MIGAFTFATTNSRSVDYTFKESGTKDEKAHSAEFYLEKDLHENAWPAFWVRLHAIAENATSNHMHESLPYEDDWLNAAQQFAQAMKTAGKNATAVQGQQAGSQPTTNPPPRNADAILLTAEQLQEIKGLLRDAKKVKAVSRVRAITGASLKDCKSFVDELSL